MDKKSPKTEEKLLETIPERIVEWKVRDESGNVVLIVPKFRKGLLKKWLQPRLKNKGFMRVTLDEVGSFVWKKCDGSTKVKDIASDLSNEFGDKVKPVEPRLNLFFNNLYHSKFIRYWKET